MLGSAADQTGHSLDNPSHSARRPRSAAPVWEASGSTTGYSISDLALCFGLPRSRIESWARRGLVRKSRGPGCHGGNVRFAEKNIVRFIRQYPHEYDLRMVDRTWFKAVVFGRRAGTGGRT